MRNRITGWAKVIASLGLMGAATYKIAKIRDKFNLSDTVLLTSRFAKYALRCRCRTFRHERLPPDFY